MFLHHLHSLCTLVYITVDVWTIAITPNSQYIATGSHSGKINLFKISDGSKATTLDTRGKFTLSIACVSD